MIVAHCIALDPNDYQANYFARAAGTARKTWNWALAESSKTCSVCGCVKKDLLLADRSWWCPECGAQHDRALNAAINRKNMAVSSTVSANPAHAGLRCDACGEEGAGLVVKNHQVKPASVKQELRAKSTFR